MRACERLGPLLDAYHDGELRGPRRWQVRRHLAGCDACRETLATLEPLGRWLREVAGSAETPDLWADVERRLPVRTRTPAPQRRRLRPVLAMPALGAVAAAALVAAIALGGLADWTGLFRTAPETIVHSLNTHGRPVMVLSGPDDETIIWLMDEGLGQAEDSTSVWI